MAFDHNMSKPSFEHLIGTLKRRLIKAAEKIGDMNKIIEKDRLEVTFLTSNLEFTVFRKIISYMFFSKLYKKYIIPRLKCT